MFQHVQHVLIDSPSSQVWQEQIILHNKVSLSSTGYWHDPHNAQHVLSYSPVAKKTGLRSQVSMMCCYVLHADAVIPASLQALAAS